MPRIIITLLFAAMGAICHAQAQIEESIDPENSDPDIDIEAIERIDINSDQSQLLTVLQLISPVQYNALRTYIAEHGPLLSVYELQAIPHFDIQTIRNALPLIFVGPRTSFRINGETFRETEHELTLRWHTILQKQKGFQGGSPSYKGSPSGILLRYRTRGRSWRAGLTAEKDPGEPFAREQLGFDHYAFYVELERPFKIVEKLLIGDYRVSMGLGLVAAPSFGFNKGANTTRLRPPATLLRPNTSNSETGYFRGLAIAIRPSDQVVINAFAGHQPIDANTDSTGAITSLPSSGLHRTTSERQNRSSARITNFGLSTTYRVSHLSLGLNVIGDKLGSPLKAPSGLHNRYRLNGQGHWSASLTYSWKRNNLYAFGETALSKNHTVSFINAVLISLGKNIELTILHRYLDPKFQHRNARTFSENTRAENEVGLYTGLEIRLSKFLSINVYHDIWRHPLPRFNIDHPSKGNEQFFRLKYERRRRLLLYLQFRREDKEVNSSIETPIRKLTRQNKVYARAHSAFHLTRGVELRYRIEYSYFRNDVEVFNGVVIYQDIIYKPTGTKFTFTTRFALFDIEDYAARIYAYENDITGNYSIPAYSDRGVRFYLNLKYRIFKALDLELRYSHTYINNKESIGSGQNEIDGQVRSEVKFQARWRF